MKRDGDEEQERRKTHHIDVPLGAGVRRARSAFPLSREKMADFLSVSVSTVQRYENGEQRIPASRLWQMCRHLNLEVGRLFAELPHNVAPPDGVAEEKTLFDHDDRRSKALYTLARAMGELETERLEIAVELVKALKQRHT